MEGFSDALIGMSERAPPWAVAAALLMATGAALMWAVASLGSRLGMFARDVGGTGATPSQVRAIVDEKVNGSDLRKVAEKVGEIVEILGELTDEVRTNRAVADQRHAENQREFGQLHGQLATRARRV